MTNGNHTTMHRGLTIMAAAAMSCLIGGTALATDDWTKSKWGPDDQIGAANNLSAEKVLEASKLITTGKTYALGIETNSQTPAYAPRSFKIYVVQPGQVQGGSLGSTKTTYNDDIIEGWLGIGSQIDGLGHIGIDGVYYNGNHAKDFVDMSGLKKLGIEKVPPITTRGVMLDMAAHYGTDVVKEGTAFNKAEIEAVAQKQGVEIRKGDVVLFNTGWISLIGQDDKRYGSVEPGLGVEGARYLAEKGVVAVGADSWALEVIPFEPGTGVFEVHQVLLAQNGIYILENMNTAELAKDKAYEFMFVLGQPRYTGAVQAIINPVAIR